MARRKLIAGNWKMNGSAADAGQLVATLRGWMEGERPFDLLLCPPFTLIDRVGRALAGSAIGLGGQDCHEKPSGAFTGEVSAAMLADLGAAYVILGHSERRTLYGESDALVKAKAAAALAAGVRPIVCVGESEADRLGGDALAVVGRQLRNSLPDGVAADRLTVAYEPVWAIGTGRTPTAAEVQEVHAHLRALLGERVDHAEQVRILYGGSVKPGNAGQLLRLPDVDGGLIGGASLKADEFWAIALASSGLSA
jgi:triosephosphate isomerase